MWSPEIDGFTRSLRAAGRSPGTIRLRTHYIRSLSRCNLPLDDVTRTDVEVWLSEAHGGLDSRRSARTSVKMFFEWCVATERLEHAPTNGTLAVRVPRTLPRPFPDPLYEHVMADDIPYRTKVMVALGRLVGLRCIEICRVHSRDLLDTGLHVVGKGGHHRVVPIVDPELRAAILSAHGYLFPGRHGGHLGADTVSRLIKGALPGHWTAHSLRHAFGTVAYASNPNLLALAEVMGHAKLDTTRRYAAVADERLRDIVIAAAPSKLASLETTAWERPRRETINDQIRAKTAA